MEKKLPAIFLGHGDPMIALANNETTKNISELGEKILKDFGKPKAILSISAHWYKGANYIQSVKNPNQIYDMYGFPEELYEVKYPVIGNKELTDEILEILDSEVSVNDEWGIDHGTWTVFVHLFPNADIPVVQLSVNGKLSPKQAYELGEKLEILRSKGYLLVGSGNIVHNLRRIEWDNKNGSKEADNFDLYIKENIERRNDSAAINFFEHGDANYSVPTLDHYLPFLYILGASKEEKPFIFNNFRELGAISMTSYCFGL